MRGSSRFGSSVAAFLAAIVLLSSCSSQPSGLTYRLHGPAESVGPARGQACGVLFLGFIPIVLNSRTERAYDAAIRSAPGAVWLDGVTLTERYTWILLGSLWCTTITGNGIR